MTPLPRSLPRSLTVVVLMTLVLLASLLSGSSATAPARADGGATTSLGEGSAEAGEQAAAVGRLVATARNGQRTRLTIVVEGCGGNCIVRLANPRRMES